MFKPDKHEGMMQTFLILFALAIVACYGVCAIGGLFGAINYWWRSSHKYGAAITLGLLLVTALIPLVLFIGVMMLN